MIIDLLKRDKLFCKITNHSLLKIHGRDAEGFLQGQLANDILKIANHRAHLNCRLSLKGKVESFFSLGRLNTGFYIFIDNALVDGFLEDINRYIIMEDVKIDKVKTGDFTIEIGALAFSQKLIPIHFLGFNGNIIENSEQERAYLWKDLKEVLIYSGYPTTQEVIGELINETILNQYGISYSKGCFFGQETPAKINSGRGGNYFPCLIEITGSKLASEMLGQDILVEGKKAGTIINFLADKNIIYAKMKRAYRNPSEKLVLETCGKKITGKLTKFPRLGWMGDEELSKHLFIEASKIYHQKEKSTQATALLEMAILLDEKNQDAYEALGVIYGHQEKYDAAIELMGKLRKLCPESIMSYANESLFYMKKGNIEMAEKLKASSVALEMKLAARQAKESKKQKADQSAQEKTREKMYREVLAIDPRDAFANYQLANLHFNRSEILETISYTQKVLESDPKHYLAQFLLGQALELRGDQEEAKKHYLEGIKFATMQSNREIVSKIQLRLQSLS